MANFNNLKKFILSFEGGYVNDPLDKGGETNKGITIGTWATAGFNTTEKIPSIKVGTKEYKNVTKSLYEMTDSQWDQIFTKFYWGRWKASEIKSQPIANILVDWAWASGIYSVKLTQRLLKLPEDGVVGPKTLAAINNYPDQRQLFFDIKEERRQYIQDIINRTPTNAKFRVGWLRRIEAITYEGLILNNGTKIQA